MNIRHSSRNDSWMTPDYILDAARDVLGEIDFDPASTPSANLRVNAFRFYTAEDDALRDDAVWNCRTCFLNPPGGKLSGKSLAALFWRRLEMEFAVGNIGQAIFVGFSLECLQTTQDGLGKSVVEYPICVPSSRIRFLDVDGKPGAAPSHGNVIAYLGPNIDKFCKAFRHIGAVSRR